MAALLVAVRRAACTLARRGRPGSLARCSVRGCSLPPGARPWLLRPGCAAASSRSAPAASSRRVGVVVRLRSRGPPPSCRLFAPPSVCVAPLVRARLARPVILCSAALRARGARLAPLARGGQQATPAGLAHALGGLSAPARGCWSVGVSATLRGRGPCRVPCAPAAPVARAGWWRRCAPCPLAAARLGSDRGQAAKHPLDPPPGPAARQSPQAG